MKRAFTLIEVLLALGITVIIGAILAASLWTATKASRTADAAVEEYRQTSTVGDILEREIANCLPPTGQLAGPFEGLSDDIQFFTTGPEPKASVQGDIRGIEYTTAASSGNTTGQTLIRRVTTNLLAQVAVTPPDQPICTGVNTLEFWYYDGTEWQDSWDSTQTNNTLPMAVKFTLTLLPAKQGGQPLTTTRIVPLSCYNPSASSSSSTTGGG
ncbi:MAG TPA: type II secretion system protein GspJ [Phycisphaerae bacterium]|nr:type II secretion system protein GspJ [Phycisphaerae bacterium]